MSVIHSILEKQAQRTGIFEPSGGDLNDVILREILEKHAGTGWDLEGYSVSGKDLDALEAKGRKASDDYIAARIKAVGSRPAYKTNRHGFLWLKKKLEDRKSYEARPDVIKYKQRLLDYTKKNPRPKSDWDLIKSVRTKTPYDRKTNYKVNQHMDWNVGQPSLQDYVTDSEWPRSRHLSKSDLRKAVKIYKTKAKKYKALEPGNPFIEPATEAFLGKAEHLLKSPKVKTIRFERR